MSGYGDEYGAYGYGSSYGYAGGGYAVYLGPGQFDLRDAATLHLDGPGSSFYASSPGRSEYVHENDNGSLFGQGYVHTGSYYATQTAYMYSADGSSYTSNYEYVRDDNGLPFNQLYSGAPVTATSGYFNEVTSTVDSGGYSHVADTSHASYFYSDGSYRTVDAYRTYERSYSGTQVPHSGTYDRSSSYYSASTGYTYTYHN